MKNCLLLISSIVLFLTQANAQIKTQFGVLPTLNLNKKLDRDWSANFKTSGRQSIFSETLNYDYQLTDFSLVIAKKIGINTKIALGYLLRVEDGVLSSRAIQQINFVRQHFAYKLAHRLRCDQTFKNNGPTKIRFRYRLSSELPLNGQSSDPKELFLKFNNEYLHSFTRLNYDLELRGAGLIGYVFTTKSKAECGIDYRIDSFINDYPQSKIWLSFNFYQSL